jgi:hypothetical protein
MKLSISSQFVDFLQRLLTAFSFVRVLIYKRKKSARIERFFNFNLSYITLRSTLVRTLAWVFLAVGMRTAL